MTVRHPLAKRPLDEAALASRLAVCEPTAADLALSLGEAIAPKGP